MTSGFDFNAAGGEAALLEHFVFDNRDRYGYPVSTAAPTQNITSTALTTMSHSNRQSLSPGTTWLPLDMTGAIGAPISIHSPTGSVSASSLDDQSGAQSPSHHSSNMSSPLQQQQHSPFQTAARPHPTGTLSDWPLPIQTQQQPTPELAQFIQDTALMGAFNRSEERRWERVFLPV